MKLPVQYMNITTKDKRQLSTETYPALNSNRVALVIPDSEHGKHKLVRPYDKTAQFLAKYGLSTVLTSNEVTSRAESIRRREEDLNLERAIEFMHNTVIKEDSHVSILAFMSGASTAARNLDKYGELIDNLVLVNPQEDPDALVQLREYRGEHFTALTSPDGSDTALQMYVEAGARRTTFDVLYDSDPALSGLAKCPDKFAELGKYVLIPLLTGPE